MSIISIFTVPRENVPTRQRRRKHDDWPGSKVTIAVPTACAVAWLLMVMWEVW